MSLLDSRAPSELTPGFPSMDPGPSEDRPRRLAQVSPAEQRDALIALAVGLAAALFLRTLLDWEGLMSTAVWWYLSAAGAMWTLLRAEHGPRVATDRVITFAIWSIGAVVVVLLIWLLAYIFIGGFRSLSWSFLTEDLSRDNTRGVSHSIIGTMEQVGIATVLTVPIAILTAIYLHEVRGRMAPVIRFVVDAMSGLPSVVAGLLIFTLWVLQLGQGYSGIACSFALVVLMIPTVTRTSEEILRTIPDPLREASLALGAPQWRTITRVVLPTARAGLLTGVILGIARAVGETAPAILTTFGSKGVNTDPLHEPQADLPLTVWQEIRKPSVEFQQVARGGALVLVLLVLILFTTARVVSTRSERKLGRR
jgi:phosphate transport system permease protein